MPNPKRRHSQQRGAKRRTHYKAELPSLATCQTTGAVHLPHHAYNVDGNLYYNGKVLIENTSIAS